MEEAFIAYLLASTGLEALVGDRIAWNILPQAQALPAVALHLVSNPRDYTYDGRIGLHGALVQVDCWAGTYAKAKLVSRAVVSALDGLNTPPFSRAFIEGERDSFEQGDGPQPTGTTNFHRSSLDVRVWHTETIT